MNTKTKIKIERKVLEEIRNEYQETREFIQKKLNELCLEYGVSSEQVRLYIFMLVMLYIQFSYAHSLE